MHGSEQRITCQRRCFSPMACRDWGYCRQRNIDAGSMKNVTPEMQAQWRVEDKYLGPLQPEGTTHARD